MGGGAANMISNSTGADYRGLAVKAVNDARLKDLMLLAISGKALSEKYLQDQTDIVKGNLYLDKVSKQLVEARVSKTGVWTGINSDFRVYGIGITDRVDLDVTSGTYTIPVGLPIGSVKRIRKINATDGVLSIITSGTETIDGNTSLPLYKQGDFIEIEKMTDTIWTLTSDKGVMYAEITSTLDSGNISPIPSGLPVGATRLIRKISTNPGALDITIQGETFTVANLSKFTLNNPSDFLKCTKVSATRWDMIEGYCTSFNDSGYQKLPSGLIIQWGSLQNNGTAGTKTADLPIAFPNKFLSVAPTFLTEQSGGVYIGGAYPKNLSQFTYNIAGYCSVTTGAYQASANTANLRYIALGY